jgi:hypothetical protein
VPKALLKEIYYKVEGAFNSNLEFKKSFKKIIIGCLDFEL